MDAQALRVPKNLRPVVLWIHPEGKVVGSLFVHRQSPHRPGEEQPLDVLNRADPFVVLLRDEPEEVRFYNRASIVRVEIEETARPPLEGMRLRSCALHMMDGSLIEGTVMKSLPPDRARLFDLLNEPEPFVKIYQDGQGAVLINKAYVMYVDEADAGSAA